MQYKELLNNVNDEQIETVNLENGQTIKCKKIPLSNLEMMETILPGIRNMMAPISSSLNYIATCGQTRLFSAVVNPDLYVRKDNGVYLSSTKDINNRFNAQPGFLEVDGVTKEGAKTALNLAKVVPVLAIALTVIEVGVKVVAHQQQIKSEMVATYKRYREEIEDYSNNLWRVIDNYPISRADEASRASDFNGVREALDCSSNIFCKLYSDAKNSKKIDENLVFAMKDALDLISFSHLLKIMLVKNVEDCKDYIDKALSDIESKRQQYVEIYNLCLKQHKDKKEKHEQIINNTQFKSNPNGKQKAGRGALFVVTGGVSEVVSLGSKFFGKKIEEKDENIISDILKCEYKKNPFVECIENTKQRALNEKKLLRDDNYLYYQVD